MIAKRWLAVALVAVSVGGTTAEASPKPKPWTRTYDLFLPQPWAVASVGATDCSRAPAGPSQQIVNLTLVHSGRLTAHLKGHVGEWFVTIYDAKGRVIASASSVGTGHVLEVGHKKGRQAYRVAVCNYAGGPNAVLTLTYRAA